MLVVLVKLDLPVEVERVEVVVESGEEAAVVGLDGLPRPQGLDDDAGAR